MEKSILAVDNETSSRNVLQFCLKRAGYSVRIAPDGCEALSIISFYVPDLVILDLVLPDVPGIELLTQWRHDPRTKGMPIIVISNKCEENDRVSCLRSGADDFVAKPFSRDELLARVEAILRRVYPSESAEVVEHNGIRLDLRNIRVTANGQPVQTGPIEFRLLHLLMTQPARVLSRAEIIDRVWRRTDYVDPRAVDVQIRRLRRRLEPAGYEHLIKTVRGVGYCFSDE